MSRATAWAIEEAMKSSLSTHARLVLIVAARYADHGTGRNIHPSASTLAKATGMHRTTVAKALAELVEAGLLIPDGRWCRNVIRYRLAMRPVAETDRCPVTVPRSCQSPLHNHLLTTEGVGGAASENGGTEDRERIEERRAALIAGQAVVVNLRRGEADEELVAWARERGLLVKVSRPTRWGNPYTIGADGGRENVIAKYRDELLPNEPKLLARLPELKGKALGCWCWPRPCHADVLAELANALPGEPGR